MPGDPNRKRRRRKALGDAQAATRDPIREAELAAEARSLTDVELAVAAVTGRMPDRGAPALAHLSDDELLALHEAELQRFAAALPTVHDAVLVALLVREGGVGPYAALVREEQERRHPTPRPEPVVARVEPVEPHPVALDAPTPVAPEPEETPRQKHEREKHERLAAGIKEAIEEGQREHELTQRLKDVPGNYVGPMLGEMLRPNGG